MKYLLSITIQNPEDKSEVVERQYLAEFYKSGASDYGNGYGMSFDTFENGKTTSEWQAYDLRYDIDFDENHPELWLTDFAYHYWSGEQGSYDIIKLSIEKMNE